MPRVMIVDDDLTTISLLETLLSMDGFDVSLVARGQEVMGRAHQDKPDIFIIDQNLNDMDGTDVVRALRTDSMFANKPIIVASGMNVEAAARDAGANLFLTKPLDPGSLANTLNSLL